MEPASVAIVGMGPRGISVVERIAAALNDPANSAAKDRGLILHLIEDSEIGAGDIWRTDQTRTLCMNTLAGAVTLFTEPGSTVSAPVVEGPVQYEWIRLLRGDRDADSTTDAGPLSEAVTRIYDRFPPAPEVAQAFAEEITHTRPESNPSRALYGAYLRWAFDVALALLPEWVTVEQHHARAIRVDSDGDKDIITLNQGPSITADSTVLAVGWQTPAANAEEESLGAAVDKHPELTWIRPGNPVDQPADDIPAGEKVLVRGLGMGFFDIMALTTIDRGGVFHPDPSTRSGLRYEPSGHEPHFVITSGRGYPYLPKSEYKSLPPKAAHPRLKKVIADLSGTGAPGVSSIDFDSEVWPAIVRDAYEAYYQTLARVTPEAIATSLDEIISIIDDSDIDQLTRAIAPHVVDREAHALDLRAWEFPLAGFSGTPEELTSYIAERMAVDIAEAVTAWDSPLKSALWSISAARKPASVLGAEGRYTFESRRNRFAALMALGQMVGSGPPLFRTRELLALVDAGLATFGGARPTVSVQDAPEGATWQIVSPTTGDTPLRSTTLIDAWMHSPDIRRTADPLSRSLEESDRTRPFTVFAADGTPAPTGSPEVDPETRRLVHPDGSIDPRVHLIGIPTYDQMADTTISPMPGTNPLMLQETDRTAIDVLQVTGLVG